MGTRFEDDFAVDAPGEEPFASLTEPRKSANCLSTRENLDIRGEEAPVRAAIEVKGRIMGSACNFGTSFDMIRPTIGKQIKRMIDANQAGMSPNPANGATR